MTLTLSNICVYLSRGLCLILLSYFFTSIELCFVFVINHALYGCKMAEKKINEKLIYFGR